MWSTTTHICDGLHQATSVGPSSTYLLTELKAQDSLVLLFSRIVQIHLSSRVRELLLLPQNTFWLSINIPLKSSCMHIWHKPLTQGLRVNKKMAALQENLQWPTLPQRLCLQTCHAEKNRQSLHFLHNCFPGLRLLTIRWPFCELKHWELQLKAPLGKK